MIFTRIAISALLLAFPSLVLAQTGEGTRGSTPPGMSTDGSRPADGAITGGPLLPGESAGMPSGASIPKTASERARERCMELTGALRDECLAKEQSASGGASAAPGSARHAEPRITPPPQNPR
jgi:hypothetical protein